MNGYAARGSITVDGIEKTKSSGFNETGCTSLMNAKHHVLKGLANRLRAHLEGTKGWTEWRDLNDIERSNWLDKVAETLHWDELKGGRIARLHSISADEFSNALVGGLV
jgi:hypothetical protein